MNVPFAEPPPPTELTVVGENRDDPSQLLLLGEDGRYYAYHLPDGMTEIVVPDNHWSIESPRNEDLFA